MKIIEIDYAEWVDIYDVLLAVKYYLEKRDEMNALMHRSKLRYSPLTVIVQKSYDRWSRILKRAKEINNG